MRTVSDPTKTREPHHAARHGFYPDDPVALAKQVAQFFAEAKRAEIDGTIVGMICPHAGYAYSGAVAAAAYKQLEGLSFDTVVVISPSHRAFFRGASVFSGGAYRSPLGEVRLDLDFCAKLTSVDPAIMLADTGHDATGGGWEHALEVHLPFLQIVLGEFALVPIVMGDQEYPTAKKLGELIARFAKPGRTLIVASSDLAHGHDYKTTKRLDDTAAAAVATFSPSDFFDQIAAGAFEACGGGPMTAMMIAARAMGADTARVVCKRNSGDVTGDKSDYIVGYLAAVMSQSQPVGKVKEYVIGAAEDEPEPAPAPSAGKRPSGDRLSAQEREVLRTAARRSLAASVKGAPLNCPEAATARLRAKRGVFITLKLDGHLRGCIGYVRPYKPLIAAVWEMTESAAMRDTRFIPVEPSEVDSLEIEITVLSPLKKLTNPDHVLVGRHGLMISRGHMSGVLLPQVPVENDWEREEFLSHTCVKAGLPEDAWRDPGTTIEVFTAEVF
jgi:hypothetical protein